MKLKFNLLLVTNRSASFELDNNDIYYSKKEFNVYVNDQLVLENKNTNVFSLYNLEPNTEYKVKVDEFVFDLKTLDESASLNVRDFGAVGDGKHDDTMALQAAINSVPKNGTLIIPEGTYYTLPLFLKSDVTIDLKKGATLLGNTDRKLYPILPPFVYHNDGTKQELGHWEGVPQPIFASIITGLYVENVNIIGEGVIDANANNSDWWDFPITPEGGAFRPRGIYINRGKNVGVQGVSVKNTPSWNVHPIFSENMKFIDIYLESHKDSPNTDGCNPESCTHVEIIGVKFSVGDDCIAIKSGKMYPDMNKPVPMVDLTIRNCHMAYGHGAVVLGSEMSGGIKDLYVSRCLFEHTDRGLRIKTRRGRGRDSVVDNVNFSNIYMDHVLAPLTINMFYNCVDPDKHSEYVWSKEALPVDERTPLLGNFTFKDMVCDNVHAAAGFFYGLPEETIKSVTIDNIHFTMAEDAQAFKPIMMDHLDKTTKLGIVAHNVDKLTITNSTVKGQSGEEVVMSGVKEYTRN